jgi:hypothetical protein
MAPEVSAKPKRTKSLGHCKVCGHRASVIRDKILTGPNDKPVVLCQLCDKVWTDYDLLCHYLPISKFHRAKIYLYGTSRVAPEKLKEPFGSPVHVNDIKPNKLVFKREHRHAQHNG